MINLSNDDDCVLDCDPLPLTFLDANSFETIQKQGNNQIWIANDSIQYPDVLQPIFFFFFLIGFKKKKKKIYIYTYIYVYVSKQILKNLGGIIRSSVFLGFNKLIHPMKRCPLSPLVANSACGGLDAMDIVCWEGYLWELFEHFQNELKAQNWRIVGLDVVGKNHNNNHTVDISQFQLPQDQNVIVVIGNEKGWFGTTSSYFTDSVTIPCIDPHAQACGIDSLNVVSALSVFLFHISQQHKSIHKAKPKKQTTIKYYDLKKSHISLKCTTYDNVYRTVNSNGCLRKGQIKKRENLLTSIRKMSFAGFSSVAELMAEQRRRDEQLRKLFDHIDVDKSGTIEFEELWGALSKLKCKLTKAELVKQWQIIDIDESGSIDFNEFKRLMTANFDDSNDAKMVIQRVLSNSDIIDDTEDDEKDKKEEELKKMVSPRAAKVAIPITSKS
ncbi:hypothetical protein RFI_26744, partial [Reticulomyxa filosa]